MVASLPTTRIAFCLTLALTTLPNWAAGDDWPQWLGPHGTNEWRETGIVAAFPKAGPPRRWRAEVGWGYAGPAVAQGRVFVTDYVPSDGDLANNPGGRENLQGTERVLCFSATDGKLLWKHEYDRPYNISYPGGPRCTPAVDAEHVFTLGAEGDLRCLRVGDGKLVWSKNFANDYEAPTPLWGFSGHPLLNGDQLICVVGGPQAAVVAWDKATGRELWRALTSEDAGYAPASMIEHAGTEQLVIWLPEGISALNPDDGSVSWTVPLKPAYGMSVIAPRKSGNYLFASGHGHVGALIELGPSATDVKVVWGGKAGRGVYCSNSTPYIEEGVIYGCDVFSGALVAARLSDGEPLWTSFEPTTGDRRAAHGTAFLVKQDERFFLLSETGELVIAKLTAEGYEELSRASILEPTNEAFGRSVVWSQPAFANKAIFARNDKELVCLDLSAE